MLYFRPLDAVSAMTLHNINNATVSKSSSSFHVKDILQLPESKLNGGLGSAASNSVSGGGGCTTTSTTSAGNLLPIPVNAGNNLSGVVSNSASSATAVVGGGQQHLINNLDHSSLSHFPTAHHHINMQDIMNNSQLPYPYYMDPSVMDNAYARWIHPVSGPDPYYTGKKNCLWFSPEHFIQRISYILFSLS